LTLKYLYFSIRIILIKTITKYVIKSRREYERKIIKK